jgi:hypothetical protein
MFQRLPQFIKIWFVLDLVLTLFPPVHWVASGADPVFGVPRSLLYIFGLCVFITLSVVAAYFAGSATAERT